MAKRKRLTPADPTILGTDPVISDTKSIGLPGGPAPIAQVAGDASASAALQELAGEVKRAKDEGRMILDLPLDQIDEGYLVRDRMMAEEEDLEILMESLRRRGQQTAIEVVQRGPDSYGLISGWRRLTAFRRLSEGSDDGKRYAQIKALIRSPDTAEDAYVSMVEENEVRVGLSYYERARVTAKAIEQGIFPNDRHALQVLFASASRAKRSKIGSFLKLYHALGDDLHFAHAIPERLGMGLVRVLDQNPDRIAGLRNQLRTAPAETVDQEMHVLESILDDRLQKKTLNKATTDDRPLPARPQVSSSPPVAEASDRPVHMVYDGTKIELSGPGVTTAFRDRLQTWLNTGAHPS